MYVFDSGCIIWLYDTFRKIYRVGEHEMETTQQFFSLYDTGVRKQFRGQMCVALKNNYRYLHAPIIH